MRWLILQNNKLVSYDPIHGFLKLFYGHPVGLAWIMELHLATTWFYVFCWTLHNLIDVFLLTTTFIFENDSCWCPHLNLTFRVFLVIVAMSQLMKLECVRALWAGKYIQVGPNLPVDLLPRNTIGFSHKSDEFFEIPITFYWMLSSKPALSVNKGSSFRAIQKFPLAFRKQLKAKSASVKVVLIFFEKYLKLLHE